METQILKVAGMTCAMCVKHVTQALQDLPGVATAVVNLDEQNATVTYNPAAVQIAQMVDAVAEEGYTASV